MLAPSKTFPTAYAKGACRLANSLSTLPKVQFCALWAGAADVRGQCTVAPRARRNSFGGKIAPAKTFPTTPNSTF